MIQAIPYLFQIAKNFRLFMTASSVTAFVETLSIKTPVESHHLAIDKSRVDKIATVTKLKEDFTSLSPTNEDTVSIGINPTTLPDYMSIQSDMTLALTEQTRNLSKQIEHSNTIATESMRIKGESEAHLESIAKTLNSALPAMVLQLQELSKLAGIASMSSEIDVAYNELALQNHDTLITTLENLQLSAVLDTPVVNVTVPVPSVTVTNDVAVPTVNNTVNVPDQTQAIDSLTTATTAQTTELSSIKNNLTAVSSNATIQERIANYKTGYGVITDVNGNVIVSTHTPLEIEFLKSLKEKEILDYRTGYGIQSGLSGEFLDYKTSPLVVKDKNDNILLTDLTPLQIEALKNEKEKEIADYQTTAQDITNLDGNVVANIKPMEAMATKNIVDAKNATDDMEFDIPDDVIDEIIGIIPLPTFHTQNIYDIDKEIFNNWSL